MPHYDQKKCFDFFDRVEGELRKEIHVPWLFTLLYVVFPCVLVSFPYGFLGLILFIPVLCLHSYFLKSTELHLSQYIDSMLE